jgi:hypothetical protein
MVEEDSSTPEPTTNPQSGTKSMIFGFPFLWKMAPLQANSPGCPGKSEIQNRRFGPSVRVGGRRGLNFLEPYRIGLLNFGNHCLQGKLTFDNPFQESGVVGHPYMVVSSVIYGCIIGDIWLYHP